MTYPQVGRSDTSRTFVRFLCFIHICFFNRIDSKNGDTVTRHNSIDEKPVGKQLEMSGHLSMWNRVWSLLQFENLKINTFHFGTIHILRKHFFYQPHHFHEFFEHFSLCTEKNSTFSMKILSKYNVENEILLI